MFHKKQKIARQLGDGLSIFLKNFNQMLWNFEGEIGIPIEYSEDDMKYAAKIFSHVLFNKMFEKIQRDGVLRDEAKIKVKNVGTAIRMMIKQHTDIDLKNNL